MFKIILVLFIISTNIFAMKAKIKQSNGDIVKVKAMFKSLMYGNGYEIKPRVKADYITNITVKANDEIILNLTTTPNFSENPLIKFTFVNSMKADNLTFYMTYNNGKQKKKSYEIYKSLKDSTKVVKVKSPSKKTIDLKTEPTTYNILQEHRRLHPKIFEKTTITQAIKNLFGSKTTTSGHLFIIAPKLAENISSIPIRIKLDIDLESLALFSDGSSYPLVAVLHFGKSKTTNFNFRFKSQQGCISLVAVGKGRNGEIYQDSIMLGADWSCDRYTKENCDKKSKSYKIICTDWELNKLYIKLTAEHDKRMNESRLSTARKLLFLEESNYLANHYLRRMMKLEKNDY